MNRPLRLEPQNHQHTDNPAFVQPVVLQRFYDEANRMATELQNTQEREAGTVPYIEMRENISQWDLKFLLRAMMANTYLMMHVKIAEIRRIDGSTKVLLIKERDEAYWKNPLTRIRLGTATPVHTTTIPTYALRLTRN